MAAISRYSPLSIILLTGLSLLSWISTYTGMLELVAASTAQVSFFAQIAIGFAVFMLQLMILYILDALFSGNLRWWLWPTYIVGYVILFAISAGFAFGFYWKYLEAGSQTTQAAGTSVQQVQQALQLGQSRLEQLQSTFTTLSAISTQKAQTEREQGGTCPRSGPGDGPRRALRESDAQRFQFASEYIEQRTQSVRADIAALTGELEKLARRDPSTIDAATGTRTAFIEQLDRRLGLVATRFNAIRTDPQLQQIRDEFAKRADQTEFPDTRGGTFICPDPQLSTALNGTVRSIDNLPELESPDLQSVEGSEAVIEAFRRLTNTGVSLVTRGTFPPSPEDLRAEQSADVRSGSQSQFDFTPTNAGLSERDYLPLMIAIFVDICILLVSINRPFGPFFNLGEALRDARLRGPMQGVFATFYDVFQDSFGSDKRPAPLQLIAPIQDVVFDYQGKYYAAVPLDFREENYQDWLNKRNQRGEVIKEGATGDSFDPRNPGSFQPLETSRYIASIFAILESEGLVSLVEQASTGNQTENGDKRRTGIFGGRPSDVDENQAKAELDTQGSVYAQADAFRIYKFKRGAWSNLLIQVVGSTAQVEERARKSTRRTRLLPGRDGREAIGRRDIPAALDAPERTEHRGDLRSVEAAESARAISRGFSQTQKRDQIPLPAPADRGPDDLDANGRVNPDDAGKA